MWILESISIRIKKWYSFCYAWNLISATFDCIFVTPISLLPHCAINRHKFDTLLRSSRIFDFLNELVSFILTENFFISKKKKKRKLKSICMEMKSTSNFFTFFMKKLNAINHVLVWHVPFMFNEACLILPSFMIDQPTFC